MLGAGSVGGVTVSEARDVEIAESHTCMHTASLHKMLMCGGREDGTLILSIYTVNGSFCARFLSLWFVPCVAVGDHR